MTAAVEGTTAPLAGLQAGDTVSVAALERRVAAILSRAGLDPQHLKVAAAGIVAAQRRGSRSHGLFHLPVYVRDLMNGAINPKPALRFTEGHVPCRTLDADNALGVVAGHAGMTAAIAAARRHGIGACAVRGSNHFGLAGHYTAMATDQGLIGVATSNAAATVAPHGGREAILGTNPLAGGFPVEGAEPIAFDMASSAVARAKLRKAAEAGEAIPEDWALGPDGRQTADPVAAMQGALLPFGGAKGSAIALMVELLSASLSGGAHGWTTRNANDPTVRPAGIGHFFLALDPEAFAGAEAFGRSAGEVAARIHGSAPVDPGQPVRLPGARPLAQEIEVDQPLLDALRRAAILLEDRP